MHTALPPHLSSVCFSDKDQTAVAEPGELRGHIQRRDRLHQVTSLCLCCVCVVEARPDLFKAAASEEGLKRNAEKTTLQITAAKKNRFKKKIMLLLTNVST